MAYRGKSRFPGPIGHLPDPFESLNPVYCLLHQRVVILHAKAASPKSQIIKRTQVSPGSTVRVRFKAKLILRRNLGVLHNPFDQFLQIIRAKECRRSAAQVYFLYPGRCAEQSEVALPFVQNCIDVGSFDTMPFGYAFVAAAERTQAFAIRQVDIQADTFIAIAF